MSFLCVTGVIGVDYHPCLIMNRDDDDDDQIQLTFSITVDCPDAVSINMIGPDRQVRGVTASLNIDSFYIGYCDRCDSDDDHIIDFCYHSVDIQSIAHVTDPQDTQISNIHSDIDANMLLSPDNITIDVDSHWNCYCKTQTVCGCGCDPLHDGW